MRFFVGVKINKVRDKKTLNVITVSACENGYEGEYICITNQCTALMSFVKKHEQRRHEKVIEIPPYFKLKQNEKHVYGVCPYDTKSAVEIIARGSDKDVLKSLDNHKYEFSLQILHNPNIATTRQSLSDETVNKDVNNLRQGKTYKKEGVASTYIKTLNQILTLRAQLEDNEELASLIILNYRGKKIKWDVFYFEPDDYVNAYNLTHVAEDIHLVCFYGVVSKTIPANEKFKYDKIKLHSPYIDLVNEVTDVPSLELVVSDKHLDLKQFNQGTEILVYGKVTAKKGAEWVVPPKQDNPSDIKKIRFLSMTVWINHAEQIVLL